MRLLHIILSFWSVFTIAACQEVFDAVKLSKLVSSDGIIRLTDRTFSKVVGGPRDYTIAVLLTAEGPQYSCVFCKVVAPAWYAIAQSWHEEHPDGDGLFFAVADISDTPETFRSLGLSHAPNLWFYKPTEKAQHIDVGYDVYQFPAVHEHARPLLDYIARQHGKVITFKEPFHYDRLVLGLSTFAAIVFGAFVYRDTILKVLQWKPVWAALVMLLILMFIAGHMFNTIRRPPYIANDGRGGIMYFVAGHSSQLVIETQIIAMVYAALSFTTISLVTKVPQVKKQSKATLMVGAMSVVILLTYSYLLCKFKIKNGGFPFTLLDIF